MSCVNNLYNQNSGSTAWASTTDSCGTNPFSQLGNLGGLQSSLLQGPMKQAMQQLMTALNDLRNMGQPANQNSNANGFGGFGFGDSGNCAQNSGFGGRGGVGWPGNFGGSRFGDGGNPGCGQFGGGGQSVGGCCQSNQSPMTVNNTGNGQAHIDLGNYTLDLDKSNMSWTLTNKQTGATTQVSGDPHVSESGNKWDFKNNDTFQLADGTRITAKTIPYGNGATVTSGLNITRPDGSTLSVSGLGGSQDGPLQVSQGFNPRARASNIGDNILFENGDNWTLGSRNGPVVNSTVANANQL